MFALLLLILITVKIVTSFDPQLLAGSRWKLVVSVGREPGTAMPTEWAASGARLAMPMDVSFLSDSHPGDEERLLIGPSQARKIEPISEPSFVGVNGLETIAVSSGGWCATPAQSPDDRSHQVLLRFFMDFDEATRNDVTMQAERVFFTTSCWINNDELAKAKEEAALIKKQVNQLEKEFRDVNEKTRGTLKKLVGLRPLVLLSEDIQRLKAKLFAQYGQLPNNEVILGPNSILLKREGMLFVKRKGGMFGMREEYHILGKFSLSPVLS